MKTTQQYNDMISLATYKIVRAISVFDKEPDHIRQQAEQIIMQRVKRMRGGSTEVIEGKVPAKQAAPKKAAAKKSKAMEEVIPEPKNPAPENPESEAPAP